MSVLNNAVVLLLADEAGGGAGYSISRSLRFNSADSAYLSRTPASAGNRKTWTWAGWVKRSKLGSSEVFISVRPSTGSYYTQVQTNVDAFAFNSRNSSGVITGTLTSAALFRDPSAWYHFAVAVDTTQSTESNRVRLYVNGVQQALSGTFPPLNEDLAINDTNEHNIGRLPMGGGLLNGCLADLHFCDGTAYDASAFGEFSATTGVWMPKAFSGSYGSQGWKLDFADNSAATAAALGKDTSGNGNNWTPTNLSVTAGAGNDSLIDVPVNGSQTDTGVGGEVRGNYATWNPLNSTATTSNGNLDSNGVNNGAVATIPFAGANYYIEITPTIAGSGPHIGVLDVSKITVSALNTTGNTDGLLYRMDGAILRNTGGSWTTIQTVATYTVNDVIGLAFDQQNNTIRFYKNGTALGTAVTMTSGLVYVPWVFHWNTAAYTANFGARSFAYTAPSGFKALCTANLPAPTIVKPSTVMDVLTWTGANTSTSRTFTGLNFSPDFVWVKNRSRAYEHAVYDTVRGAGFKSLATNTTAAQNGGLADRYGYLSAFNSDGFTFTIGSFGSGADPDGYAYYDELNATYVAWTWDGGSSTVTNTAGTITSSVRANASAGFSVLTYLSNGTNGATFGHGLGVAPQFIIIKAYTAGGAAFGWAVYHQALGNTKYLLLESTAAAATSSTVWNNTSPTSTVVTLGTNDLVNYSSGLGYVAYCFAPVAGYSAFGSYTGNGSADGPFVYTGFRPRWLMIKNTIDPYDNGSLYQSHSWVIRDTARSASNAATVYLGANKADAEVDAWQVDILSNGFKVRTNTGSDINKSGNTMIYAAFAESPFQYSRAR
jgi:hypothetical protein